MYAKNDNWYLYDYWSLKKNTIPWWWDCIKDPSWQGETTGDAKAIGDTPGLFKDNFVALLDFVDGVFNNTAGLIGNNSGLCNGLANCSSSIGKQLSSTKLPSCGLNISEDRTRAEKY